MEERNNARRIWVSTPRCTSHLGEYAAKIARLRASFLLMTGVYLEMVLYTFFEKKVKFIFRNCVDMAFIGYLIPEMLVLDW